MEMKDFMGSMGGKMAEFMQNAAMLHELHEHMHKIDGLQKTLDSVCEYAGLPRKCLAPDGVTPLKVGDVVYCKKDKDEKKEITKTVLEVGWRWVVLSRTDDQKKVDGRWPEDQIRQHGMALTPELVGKHSHSDDNTDEDED